MLEVVKFTDEVKKALKEEGFTAIYTLTSQSIRSLWEAGRPFGYIVGAGQKFLTLPSRLSEVAVNPDPKKFFLPESNNKTLEEQVEMVADFSQKLAKKVDGAKALLGEAPDYAELAFLHLDATGDRLFGERYNYHYTRTQTPAVGFDVARVGDFYANGGLTVRGWFHDYSFRDICAAPLVVPAETR